MTTTNQFRQISVQLGALALAFIGIACGNGSATNGTTGGSGASGHMGGTAGSAGTAGGGTTGTGGATDNSPVGMCKQLIATLCTRSNDCNVGDAGTVDVAQCSMLQNIAFGCDRATSTMFSSCLSDVKALSCAGLFSSANGLALPGSCDAPLNIPPSDAQTKCVNVVDVICDPTEVCNNVAPTQTQAFMACESDGIQQVGCAFVVSVSATYNQCLKDLCATADGGTGGGTPDGGASAPASCNSVFM